MTARPKGWVHSETRGRRRKRRRRTTRENGSLRMSRSVLFWYLRISRRATVPGRNRFSARRGHTQRNATPGVYGVWCMCEHSTRERTQQNEETRRTACRSPVLPCPAATARTAARIRGARTGVGVGVARAASRGPPPSALARCGGAFLRRWGRRRGRRVVGGAPAASLCGLCHFVRGLGGVGGMRGTRWWWRWSVSMV